MSDEPPEEGVVVEVGGMTFISRGWNRDDEAAVWVARLVSGERLVTVRSLAPGEFTGDAKPIDPDCPF